MLANLTAYLEESVLLLRLKLVGTKQLQTTTSLLFRKTILIALEEFEDIVDDDSLEIDFILIVRSSAFS